MQPIEPQIEIEAARMILEATLIREEAMALVAEVQGKQPTRAQLKRARELQARRKQLDRLSDTLLCRELSVWMAVRERLGRQPVDGDDVLPEDERRAEQIIDSFGL